MNYSRSVQARTVAACCGALVRRIMKQEDNPTPFFFFFFYSREDLLSQGWVRGWRTRRRQRLDRKQRRVEPVPVHATSRRSQNGIEGRLTSSFMDTSRQLVIVTQSTAQSVRYIGRRSLPGPRLFMGRNKIGTHEGERWCDEPTWIFPMSYLNPAIPANRNWGSMYILILFPA